MNIVRAAVYKHKGGDSFENERREAAAMVRANFSGDGGVGGGDGTSCCFPSRIKRCHSSDFPQAPPYSSNVRTFRTNLY